MADRKVSNWWTVWGVLILLWALFPLLWMVWVPLVSVGAFPHPAVVAAGIALPVAAMARWVPATPAPARTSVVAAATSAGRRPMDLRCRTEPPFDGVIP